MISNRYVIVFVTDRRALTVRVIMFLRNYRLQKAPVLSIALV